MKKDDKKFAKEEIENLEIETLLSGKYDINNAIVTIHPGAGGTESHHLLIVIIPSFLLN